MSSRFRHLLASLGLLLLTTSAGMGRPSNAAQPVLSLSARDIASLTGLRQGGTPLAIRSDGSKRDTAWRFHAIPLQTGSQPLADDPDGRLAKRRFLISERGPRQIALAFESDGSFAFGFLDDGNGLQKLVAQPGDKAGLSLFAEVIEQPPVNCDADRIQQPDSAPRVLQAPMALVSSMAKGTVDGYQAKVAVEVDQPMMSGHFGNSEAAAKDWLQQLFLATNLFYQRDLTLQLVMATPVIYDTSADPYCTGANPCPAMPSGAAELMFQFGDYWRNNHSDGAANTEENIDRDFATLISGRLTGGNPTGVSWINQYCQNGSDQTVGTPSGPLTVTTGSYGVNLYVAGNGVSGGAAAELFGHELGHQLGAYHNNCTDAEPGISGLQPIDKCRTGGTAPPGGSCWSGALACPSAGAGQMMSSGCADPSACGISGQSRIREFHPIQINLLTSNIQSHTPSCLGTATLPDPDILFYDGFE